MVSNVEDKKLVLKCIKFGIFGGLFLVVAPTVLYISLMGLSIPLFLGTACLVSYTVIGILITAIESKNYYKGDSRVHKWVADLFLLVGILAFVPIFIRWLGDIPFLSNVLPGYNEFIQSGDEPFANIFLWIRSFGVLSIIGGFGYANCIENFKE